MFRKNFKNIRLQCGFSQRYVAEYLNISPQSISKWEKGDALPSIEFLPRLAECFDCRIDDFFVKECTNQEEINILTSYFKIDTEDEHLDKIKEFVRNNPSVVDIVTNFCSSLEGYSRINERFIQNQLVCSKEDAEVIMKGLERWSMVAHIERGNYIALQSDIYAHKMLMSLLQETMELERKQNSKL